MYRYSAPGDASRRTPEPDDLEGLAVLYAPLASPGGCAEAGGGTFDVHRAGGWILAALLAAGALARRRASRSARVSP
jgi:hypothetical protein